MYRTNDNTTVTELCCWTGFSKSTYYYKSSGGKPGVKPSTHTITKDGELVTNEFIVEEIKLILVKKLELDIVPFRRIGPFYFDVGIRKYTRSFSFEITRKTKNYSTQHYRLSSIDLTLFVDEGKIESIGCYQSCTLFERELIGMNIKVFENVFKVRPFGKADKIYLAEASTPHLVYEYEQLGLQLWVKNGKIDQVMAYSI